MSRARQGQPPFLGAAQAAKLLLVVFALLASGCTKLVAVHDACETFVHRDTPPVSPEVRRINEFTLELLVEVAATDEGRAVVAAARKEPIVVQVYPSERVAHVDRVEGDRLVISTSSPERIELIKETLCIRPGDP
jgi:hypothetical protein